MKRIHNYILLSVLAIAATGCLEEEFDNNTPSAESGDDVQFGLSLGGTNTKTIYGAEANNAFPIYWVNGDKVQIFSPQCLEDRRSAEYQVSVESTTQNYATSLTKTGDAGVQWGTSETADFYSLYPSGNYSLSNDGTKAENININYSQSIIIDGANVNSDMEDCLLYAKTEDVVKGNVVELHYDPITTVFMVNLNVSDESYDSFVIQSISLTAANDTKIAGTFSLNIANGTFGEWSTEASSTVTAQIYDNSTGGYLTLAQGGSVTIPLFIAPVQNLNTEGWKIKVVANSKEYVKTLDNLNITAGKIHKVTLPKLSTETTTEWDVSKWMTYIPRNVYLSEVSIPGSWNSLNRDFQNSTNIATQYAAGVRAFHLDTRWSTTQNCNWVGVYTESDLDTEQMYLSVADGNTGRHVRSGSTALSTSYGQIMEANNTSLSDYLASITSNVKEDEYMVVFCTFAQNSYSGDYCPSTWYAAVSAACAANELVQDARNITPETLVGDVLGSVIVIVNISDEITDSTVLPSDSKCFFTNFPAELTSAQFDTDYSDNYDKLWCSASNTNIASDSKITIFNSQAQITSNTGTGISTNDRGYAPSITERNTILEAILDWSKANYGTENYMHDQWIYLGLGGYQVADKGGDAVSGSYNDIATTYNTWIQKKVAEMGTTPEGSNEVVPYYPVGIVLMNYATNYSATLKDILTLNNKYRLQYDSSKPSDYNPNALAASEYSSTASTGGDAF